MINAMRRTLHEPCHDSRGFLKKTKYNKLYLFFIFYFLKKKGGNIHGMDEKREGKDINIKLLLITMFISTEIYIKHFPIK
jgi:hypothetical protein